MRIWLFFVCVALLLTACSSDKEPTAGDAVKRQLDYFGKGQWGKRWEELHPSQQQVVLREKYIECSSKSAPPKIANIKILETYDEDLAIPGIGTPAKSTAVTFQADVNNSSGTKQTVNEYYVNGKWRWVLSASAVDSYRNGQCPI